jgi:hypothetical protein
MNPIYRQVGGEAAVSPAMANAVTGGSATVIPVNASFSGCNTMQFKEFGGTSFTLAGTNGGGAAANVKMQSADDVTECITGTLGAISFTVNELPDRAGLALGGATLAGIDALRKRLLMFGLFISYINYSASTAAQLNNPLRVIYGYLDGSSYTESKSVSKDANNQQFVATLIPITGEWVLTGNAALQLVVNAGVSVNLTFAVKTLVPYNRAM